jgi:hypothetical protein
LGIAILKGYLLMLPDYEGGVGGLLSWKMMLGSKPIAAIRASTIIN